MALPHQMRKGKLFLAIVFGIFWAFLVAEIGSRVMVSRGQLPNRAPADIFAAHEIGWALEPDFDAWISGGNGIINIQTNADGFRDDDYPQDNPTDRPRILVLGDSFTIALETPQEQTYHTRLESRFAGDVMSLGVSGYELAQNVLVYEEVGRDYQSDSVLLMLYVGNDLTGNNRWPELPRYALNGQLERVNFPYSGPFSLDLVTSQRSSFLMRQSVIVFIAGSILRGGRGSHEAGSSEYCDYWNNAHYPNPTADEWALSEALIRRLRDEVEGDGASLRVAIIPTEFQAEPEFLDEFLQSCELPPHARESRVQDHLIDFLKSEGIDYLDLMPVLSAQDGLMYLPGVDIHWTPQGHAVVADALFDWYSD
jgi:hypothetical protein